MRKLYLENNKPKKRILRITRFIVVLVVVLVVLEVWMVNRLSTYGDKIQSLKVAQADLELENQILENQISQNGTMLNLESKAKALGFDTTKNLEYFRPANIASAL